MKYIWRMSVAAVVAVFCALTFSTSAALADGQTPQSDICAGISGTSSTDPSTNKTNCSSSNSTSSVSTIIKDVIDVLSTIAGAAAVIMIIIAGFQYVTSGGDSGKIGNARTNITYALVGIVIVAFAQFLVQFVLNRVGK